MQDLVTVLSNEDGIQISLDVQQDAVLQIGEMMQEIQEEAYMNGENWAVFFQYYLGKYAPNLLEGLESDSEAGMYVAYYDKVTPENHRKAMQLADLFNALLSHPEQIYQILRTTEDEIEWVKKSGSIGRTGQHGDSFVLSCLIFLQNQSKERNRNHDDISTERTL